MANLANLNNLTRLNRGYGSRRDLSFSAPLTSSVVPAKGAVPTFTRGSTATIEDHEGIIRTVKSGEVRFWGARRVSNLVSSSQDFSVWSSVVTGGGSAPTIVSSTETAPDGTATATKVTFTPSAAGTSVLRLFVGSLNNPSTLQPTIYVKADSATSFIMRRGNGSAGYESLNATTSWQRIAGTAGSNAATSFNFDVGAVNSATPVTIYLWGAQLEDVTGQTNQNPAEYVSVGVLSSPFHGAMVDGVKYFNSPNLNTVSSNVLTEPVARDFGTALSFDGSDDIVTIANNTPITILPASCTNFTISSVFKYVPGTQSDTTIVQLTKGEGLSTNNTGFWYEVVESSKTLRIGIGDGSARQYRSAVALVPNNWYFADVTFDNGLVTFYIAGEQVAQSVWTLGTAANCTDTDYFTIGAAYSVGSPAAENKGVIKSVRIYNRTLSATEESALYYQGTVPTTGLVAEYLFNEGAGTTATDSSGNGNHGTITGATYTDDTPSYLGSATLKGVFSGEYSRTNVLTNSNAFQSWTLTDTTATANNVVAKNGYTEGCLLTEGVAGTALVANSAGTLTAATNYAASAFLKRGNTDWVRLFLDAGANSVSGWFNLNTGAVGTLSAAGTGTASEIYIENWGSGWYRCVIVGQFSGAIATNVALHSASADASTIRVNSATYYAWGGQCEAGGFASTLIPTTSASIARSTDLLGYNNPTANFNAIGSVYAEIALNHAYTNINPSAWRGRIITGNTLSRTALDINPSSATADMWDGTVTVTVGTNTLQWVRGVVYKLASSWSGTTMQVSEGGVSGSGVFDGSIHNGDTGFRVGSANGETVSLFGGVKNLKIYRRAYDTTKLNTLTT